MASGGEPISFGPLLLTAIGILGGFATFLLAHPKEKYGEEIPEIKQNRLSDVCNALGPVVSDSYDFASDDGDQAHEDLSSDNKATIAVTQSISAPDDLPPIKEALEDFYEPEKTFQRCRQVYFGSYGAFVISILAGAAPTTFSYFNSSIPNAPFWGAIATWMAVLAVLVGAGLLGYFIRLNSKLDSMTEGAKFTLE